MPCAQDSLLHCTNEMQTVKVSQQSNACVTMQVRGSEGEVIDLRDLVPFCEGSSSQDFEDDALTVHMVVRETWTGALMIVDKEGEIIDYSDGTVRFQLTDTDLQYAGIYVGDLVLKDNDGNTVHTTRFFLSIEPSMDATFSDLSPALTIAWIRMMVRDTCPEANYLLDELEYSDAEIMMALRNPIDEWNETPPDLGAYTPRTFPFRNHHAKAAIGELLQMAGLWYLRNHLSYSAGAVAVNDRDKASAYLQLAEAYKEKWSKFIINKKIEINIAGGFMTLRSSYSASYGYV